MYIINFQLFWPTATCPIHTPEHAQLTVLCWQFAEFEITSKKERLIPSAKMSIDNVGSSLGMGSGSDPKAMLMNQVRQEAALNNARQLIEVCFPALVYQLRSSVELAC